MECQSVELFDMGKRHLQNSARVACDPQLRLRVRIPLLSAKCFNSARAY